MAQISSEKFQKSEKIKRYYAKTLMQHMRNNRLKMNKYEISLFASKAINELYKIDSKSKYYKQREKEINFYRKFLVSKKEYLNQKDITYNIIDSELFSELNVIKENVKVLFKQNAP